MQRAGLIAAAAVALGLAGGLAYLVLDDTRTGKNPGDPNAQDISAFVVEAGAARVHPQGDVLRGAVPEPATLNPFTTMDSVAVRYILPATHDTLFDRDPQDASLRPAVATAATWSDDRRTLTFTLRDDLVFADGAPVTLDDLRFTLEVARHPRTEPRSDMSYWLAEAAGAEAPDLRTLIVRFDEPALEADRIRLATSIRIAQRAFFVAAVQQVRDELAPEGGAPLADEFVDVLASYRGAGPGTGPYQIANLPGGPTGAQHIDLVRNPHSWQRSARPESWNLAGVRHELLVDDAARFAALRQGRLDWFSASGGASADELLARYPELGDRFVVHSYDPAHLGHYYVLWNCKDELLDDARVRRALGMLFDRRTLLDQVFGGKGSIARGYFKPGMPEYPGAEVPAPAFDPAAARTLLREVDDLDLEGEPPRIEILLPAAPTQRRILELAADAFRQAGLQLVAVPADPVSISQRVASGDFQGVILVEQHDLPIDPYDRFHSRGNAMGYASAEMDDLVERARRSTDATERLELYARFHQLLREDQPITLLIHPQIELLLHRRFQDARPGPLGLWFERFWVPVDQQIVVPPRPQMPR